MSKETVKSFQAPFLFSFSLLEAFIDTCPENIWAENNGGWPVWQQVYHALGATNFFTMKEGDQPNDQAPYPQEVGMLSTVSTDTMPRAKMKELAGIMKAKGLAYLESLDDSMLPAKNEFLSARVGKDFTYATIVSMLAAHILYHLGSCDAALRDHGLKGVF